MKFGPSAPEGAGKIALRFIAQGYRLGDFKELNDPMTR
jgi:hypothetical protein